MTEPKEWDTHSILFKGVGTQTALIILNTPLVHQDLFADLWNAASLRYCADGGANRLFDRFHANLSQTDDVEWLPDLVKGDFDSVRPEVLQFYQERGVRVQHDPDEYSTDLGKCVKSLAEFEQANNCHMQLVVVGGLSGRLDQTIHTIHALTLLASERPKSTWALGPESLACVLDKGTHRLQIDQDRFGVTCGVLPVGQEARVETSGLEWDLGPTAYMYPTSIASEVSTSNRLKSSSIQIQTDVPIVWTVEVKTG